MSNVSKCFYCANKKDYDMKFGYFGCNYSGQECKNYSMFEPKAKPKSKTNADRIRAMSDEELADFFGTLPCCPPGSAEELCYPENTCGADTKMMVKCWGTWLKSPVEEVDNA